MPPKKKILVVDDESDIVKILSMRLKVNGYDVISALDGEDGLNKAKTQKPDLIILDLMLPKLSGYEICRMLKFDDEFKSIPIIILSALHEQQEREKTVESGADAFFLKPFDLEQMLAKLKELLG
jgi:DNA-binding response OmpR family regulator